MCEVTGPDCHYSTSTDPPDRSRLHFHFRVPGVRRWWERSGFSTCGREASVLDLSRQRYMTQVFQFKKHVNLRCTGVYAVEFSFCIRWSVFSFVIGIRISPALMLISSRRFNKSSYFLARISSIDHFMEGFFHILYSNAHTSASVWFWDFALALYMVRAFREKSATLIYGIWQGIILEIIKLALNIFWGLGMYGMYWYVV